MVDNDDDDDVLFLFRLQPGSARRTGTNCCIPVWTLHACGVCARGGGVFSKQPIVFCSLEARIRLFTLYWHHIIKVTVLLLRHTMQLLSDEIADSEVIFYVWKFWRDGRGHCS
jgi:hypothetical protein